MFEGEKMSLSRSAGLSRSRDFGWRAYVGGPDYWEYDGEILNVRRKRLEGEARQRADEEAGIDDE